MSDVLYRPALTPTQLAGNHRANAFRASVATQAAQLKQRRAPVLLAVVPEAPPPTPDPLIVGVAARVAKMAAYIDELFAQIDEAKLELKQTQAIVDEQQKILELAEPDGQYTPISINEIQVAVCSHYGISQTEIQSNRRSRVVGIPRFVAMWLCRRLTKRSLPQIGRKFGGRDHTTVINAGRNVEKMRRADADFEALLVQFIKQLAPWDTKDNSIVLFPGERFVSVACSQPNEAQQCNSPSITAI
jgi:chromosomal replication initiation ATPase DnaA